MIHNAVVSRTLRYAVTAVATIALWIVATIPAGFSPTQLLVFAGPGIVLAVAASWAAHAFSPERWEWDDALVAGVFGAALFPPIVGFFIAWSATFSPNVMVVLLVFSAWAALGSGLAGALVSTIVRRRRARLRAARMELLD